LAEFAVRHPRKTRKKSKPQTAMNLIFLAVSGLDCSRFGGSRAGALVIQLIDSEISTPFAYVNPYFNRIV
jgi:hypothetical protein